jgi:hypothetical protein
MVAFDGSLKYEFIIFFLIWSSKNLTRTREKHFYSTGKEMIEKSGVSLIKDLLETVLCQL